MKKSAYIRFSITVFLLLSMLSPTALLAATDDGKKHYKQGLKHEYAEEWDKAAEEFALAIIDDARNPEYKLHYQRALFNASQMFMKQGTAQAEQGDYAGAYISFRKAYGYDPVNELARSEMQRMIRLQKGLKDEDAPDPKTDQKSVRLVQTTYGGLKLPTDFTVPQQLEKLRDVPFPNDVSLTWLIKELAKDLDLNVLFDSSSRLDQRKLKIELKNVTAAKAMDYVFLQENLFFQRVGPRTILVADGNQRQKFQQLVLRTFYLANASPKDVANVVKTAIPAQPGRTPTIVLTDEPTNSITIRDTTENIRLIGKLISSLDKDRAEVVMDVAIYEVSNTDLLQLGNQIGDSSSLTTLGGTTRGVVGIGGNDTFGGNAATAAASIIPRAFGVGVVIPAVNIIALQQKDNTKLIASTQIHAFNNEKSSARIGQRVPVRTAAISNGFNNNNNNGTNNGGSSFVGDVINYEPTGLTLNFKPLVFPNKDVQVEMEIESKDVAVGGETPTFTERTIKGTARVQNNKTLLLASVAQNTQSEGRTGLPILGLIPIIGRLFTAPKKNNRQTDIVIAVTPRVIRAPDILPEDLEERESGSLAVPTSSSLEAMIIQEEVDEQLASARRLGNNARVQLPDRAADELDYVKSNDQAAKSANIESKTDTEKVAANANDSASIKGNTMVKVSDTKTVASPETRVEKIKVDSAPTPKSSGNQNVEPLDKNVKTLQIEPAGDTSQSVVIPENNDKSATDVELKKTSLKSSFVDEIKTQPFTLTNTGLAAELQLLPGVPKMKKGEKLKLAVLIKSQKAFRSAVIGLNFDPKKLAIRGVTLGEVFGAQSVSKQIVPFMNKNGKMYATLSVSRDVGENDSGVLAYIEVEALSDGKHELSFDKDILSFLTSKGENFAIKF